MDIEYVDVLIDNILSILVASIDLIYWSVHSSSKREGNGVKRVVGVY